MERSIIGVITDKPWAVAFLTPVGQEQGLDNGRCPAGTELAVKSCPFSAGAGVAGDAAAPLVAVWLSPAEAPGSAPGPPAALASPRLSARFPGSFLSQPQPWLVRAERSRVQGFSELSVGRVSTSSVKNQRHAPAVSP